MTVTLLERARFRARADVEYARLEIIGHAEGWHDLGGAPPSGALLRRAVEKYRRAAARWMRIGRGLAAAERRDQARAREEVN